MQRTEQYKTINFALITNSKPTEKWNAAKY